MTTGLMTRIHGDGDWIDPGTHAEVVSPYDGETVAPVSVADLSHVDAAMRSAEQELRWEFALCERAEILERASQQLREWADAFAAVISREAGKPISQARMEAERAAETLPLSAMEARRLRGEIVPLDATRGGVGKTAYTLRVPVGVVAAIITPFNLPLNLVCHKVGPALGAANVVVLKPALSTPLSAIELGETLFEAGLPPRRLQVVFGAGLRVLLELGFDLAAHRGHGRGLEDGRAQGRPPRILIRRAELHSVQRILVNDAIADAFAEELVATVEELRVGDPALEETAVGPLIDAAARCRVLAWVDEARQREAAALAGGRENADGTIQPTVIDEPPLDARVWRDEAFGPVVSMRRFAGFDEAIALANDSDYGLQVGVFTQDLGRALRAARRLEFGGVPINEVPTYRADMQPYGGVKTRASGREGPAWAVRELSEERLISLQ